MEHLFAPAWRMARLWMLALAIASGCSSSDPAPDTEPAPDRCIDGEWIAPDVSCLGWCVDWQGAESGSCIDIDDGPACRCVRSNGSVFVVGRAKLHDGPAE